MLINNWKMKFLAYEPLDCTAPCSMYSVLLEHKKIEDPFYGTNEQEATKLSEEDCCFYTSFEVSEDDYRKENMELIFYGLDTLCEIYLNDKLLDTVKNMHRTYVYDVKEKVQLGSNSIRLEFKSPIKYFNKMNDKHYLWTATGALPGVAHLRKGLSMSGWDWGVSHS